MSNTTYYKIAGMAVHLLTASCAVIGLFTLVAIMKQQYMTAFALMTAAVIIDAIDGTLARRAHVKTYLPNIDGALMDNIVDFINYALTPCFLALTYTPMLPNGIREILLSLVLFASIYQFTQADAKTDDHFFKGFPSYWNILILYFYVYATSPWLNALILLICIILVFVPIKYLYISRMEHAIKNKLHRQIILALSIIWGFAIVGMMITYQHPWMIFLYYTGLYSLGYLGLSVFITLRHKPI